MQHKYIFAGGPLTGGGPLYYEKGYVKMESLKADELNINVATKYGHMMRIRAVTFGHICDKSYSQGYAPRFFSLSVDQDAVKCPECGVVFRVVEEC